MIVPDIKKGLQMIEDELLKWEFRRGSRDALARIYEKYLDVLLTLATGLLNNRDEAQDVVQDVFVTFARVADHFELDGSLKAYLTTSVVNRVRDRMRRARAHEILGNSQPVRDTGEVEPVRQVSLTEDCERLRRALADLPYEQREVIVLRIKGNMRFRDIARLQAVSVSTVQGRYRYSLQRLRTLLDGEGGHEAEI